MEGVEEEGTLLLPEGASPQNHHRMLKRLKKASEVADLPMRHSPASRPWPEFSRSQDDASEDGESPDGARSESQNEEADFDDGLDPLFGVQCRLEESRVESFDSETEMKVSEEVGGLDDADGWTGERVDEPGKKISAKKRLSMEEGQEDSKRKKVASGKRLSKDGKLLESAREKRKLEKERKVYLEHLHAESQKLLRETRDAFFKPVIIADKPISSVLEKIRRRKFELLKRSTVTNDADRLPQVHGPILVTSDAKDLRSHDENEKDLGEISRSEEDTPGSGVQESADDFQHCNNEDDKSVDCINEIHDDNGVPSLLGVDLGHNSDASDDSSSEEEDYDKENINPCPDEPVPVNLCRKNDLIKGFVDEEAEEEDDSDHDLMRFQDDENEDEDDDSDEAEVFNGLIASGYKEKPLDAEKRNELHQRWLQHQDAAATDNLLQRLNSHTKQKGPYIVENEADEEEPEEDDSEPLSDPPPVNAARQNARQAKEKMAQMFTDSEDAYISDDEETEQRLLRGNLVLHQTVERSSVLSPAEEDETSREVFSLIRKLNTVPDTRRRPSSLPANFDTLAVGGNGSSFKPSFLGRTTVNPLTSSLRQGMSVSRSFVFGRDDSNSRGSDRSSEIIPDAPGDLPPKTNKGPGRVSASQAQSNVLKRTSSDAASSASLFDILRRTSCHRVDRGSLSSSALTGDPISASQTARQFSAFRLTKKT